MARAAARQRASQLGSEISRVQAPEALTTGLHFILDVKRNLRRGEERPVTSTSALEEVRLATTQRLWARSLDAAMLLSQETWPGTRQAEVTGRIPYLWP